MVDTFVGPKGAALVARHGSSGHWGGTSESLERCGCGEARSTDCTTHGPCLCQQLGEHGSRKEQETNSCGHLRFGLCAIPESVFRGSAPKVLFPQVASFAHPFVHLLGALRHLFQAHILSQTPLSIISHHAVYSSVILQAAHNRPGDIFNSPHQPASGIIL